jgi:hypothetical protein
MIENSGVLQNNFGPERTSTASLLLFKNVFKLVAICSDV